MSVWVSVTHGGLAVWDLDQQAADAQANTRQNSQEPWKCWRGQQLKTTPY